MFAILGSAPQFDDCKIRENRATGAGGGLYFSLPGSGAMLVNCELIENQSGEAGGGISCLAGTRVTVVSSRISQNVARTIGSEVYGARESTIRFTSSAPFEPDFAGSVRVEGTCRLGGAYKLLGGLLDVGRTGTLILADDVLIELGRDRDGIVSRGNVCVRDRAVIRNTRIQVSNVPFDGAAKLVQSILVAEGNAPGGTFFERRGESAEQSDRGGRGPVP